MTRMILVSTVIGIAGVVALIAGSALPTANWLTFGTGMFLTNFPIGFLLIVLAGLSILGILAGKRYALIVFGMAGLCFLGYTYQANASGKRNFEKAEIELWQKAISTFPSDYKKSSDTSDKAAGTAQMLGDRKSKLMAEDYSATWILLLVGNLLVIAAGLVGTPSFHYWFQNTFGFLFKKRL